METKYLKHLYGLEEQASGLLGFFDAGGNYILEETIIKELIACNKQIVNYTKDQLTAVANFPDFKIDFIIYLQDGENNKKRAGLFVIEKCKLQLEKNEIQTYVDSFVCENTPVFFDELKKKYHLFNNDESEGVDLSNSGFVNIIKKKSATKNYKTMIPMLLNADKEYVKRMLATIKNSGTYGEQFLLLLKKKIEENKLAPTNPNYWRELRLLLDKMLKENFTLFNNETITRMEQIQSKYVDVFNNTKIEEKKPEAKNDKPKKKKEAKKSSWDGIKPLDTPKGNSKNKKEKSKDDSKEPVKVEKNKVTVNVQSQTTIVEETVKVKQTIITESGLKVTREYEMFGRAIENTVVKTKEAPKKAREEEMSR